MSPSASWRGSNERVAFTIAAKLDLRSRGTPTPGAKYGQIPRHITNWSASDTIFWSWKLKVSGDISGTPVFLLLSWELYSAIFLCIESQSNLRHFSTCFTNVQVDTSEVSLCLDSSCFHASDKAFRPGCVLIDLLKAAMLDDRRSCRVEGLIPSAKYTKQIQLCEHIKCLDETPNDCFVVHLLEIKRF